MTILITIITFVIIIVWWRISSSFANRLAVLRIAITSVICWWIVLRFDWNSSCYGYDLNFFAGCLRILLYFFWMLDFAVENFYIACDRCCSCTRCFVHCVSCFYLRCCSHSCCQLNSFRCCYDLVDSIALLFLQMLKKTF